jgi:hypothetical protein
MYVLIEQRVRDYKRDVYGRAWCTGHPSSLTNVQRTSELIAGAKGTECTSVFIHSP